MAVTISNSIFLMVGFLMIFGWVGIAKVSRSMALQIKTRGYVEAAKMMGQRDSVIIFRHMIPQLLPLRVCQHSHIRAGGHHHRGRPQLSGAGGSALPHMGQHTV